jgi:hypothetical protein
MTDVSAVRKKTDGRQNQVGPSSTDEGAVPVLPGAAALDTLVAGTVTRWPPIAFCVGEAGGGGGLLFSNQE